MNIDKKIREEKLKLRRLSHKKFADRLAGKYVIFAGLYSKFEYDKGVFKNYYTYYINPQTALTVYHKRAAHLIDQGLHVKPIRKYPPFSFHPIAWSESPKCVLNPSCFLFNKKDAKDFTANSPYPPVLFNAIKPAAEAKPNDLFFKPARPKSSNGHSFRIAERD